MANFNLFTDTIQQAEGGYQKLANDSGNYNSKHELVGTNHGIAATFYETIIGYPPSEADMRAITKATALQLFKHYFWDKIKADQINSQAVAETFADMAINSSPKRATKIMQKTLNNYFGKNLQVDGIVGNKTLAAINSVDSEQLFDYYNIERENYYRSLSSFAYWGKSWLRRIALLVEKHKNSFKKGSYIITMIALFGIMYYLTKSE